MGRVFLRYVETETVHCCVSCRAHLASHDQIISKAFQGRHGRAYLFGEVVNVNAGPTENRLLLTGLHVVADIYCNACDARLGWKYVEAFEESQKYKEGKFILEKALIMKEEELRQRRAEQLERLAEARRRTLAGEHPTPEAHGGGRLGEDEDEEDYEDEDEDEEEDEDDDEEEGGARTSSNFVPAPAALGAAGQSMPHFLSSEPTLDEAHGARSALPE